MAKHRRDEDSGRKISEDERSTGYKVDGRNTRRIQAQTEQEQQDRESQR